MKYIALLFLIILASCKQGFEKAEVIPSKVDSLKTVAEIRDYLSVIDTNLKYFHPISIQQLETNYAENLDRNMRIIAKNLNIDKGLYREDFDNNGYTDLLLLGGFTEKILFDELYSYNFFVIMNFGKQAPPKLISLRRKMQLLDVPEIVHSDEGPLLVVYSPEKMHGPDAKITDTISIKLAYRYGGFAEYNKQPIDNHIEKIKFESGSCFGRCPIYTLTINKDQSAEFLAEHYNFPDSNDVYKKEGLFNGQINTSDYKELINLLNYIDFKNLKDQYSAGGTCGPTVSLTITYENGKTKTISDYGMSGTYGLKSVYAVLSDFRFNQKWEKVPETNSK